MTQTSNISIATPEKTYLIILPPTTICWYRRYLIVWYLLECALMQHTASWRSLRSAADGVGDRKFAICYYILCQRRMTRRELDRSIGSEFFGVTLSLSFQRESHRVKVRISIASETRARLISDPGHPIKIFWMVEAFGSLILALINDRVI